MDALQQALEQAAYPLAELEISPYGPDEVEIEATLMATSVNAKEMDKLVLRLSKNSVVRHVYWQATTAE